MQIKKIILFLLFGVFALGVVGQTDTEFWFSVPKLSQGHGWDPHHNHPHHPNYGRKFFFRFANMDQDNTITIYMPASANPNPGPGEEYFEPIVLNVAANEAVSVDVTDKILDMWVEHPYNEFDPNSIYDRGIRITATQLTTAYFEVGTHYNPDIYSLKGANALGTNFVVPFQNYFNNGNYNPKPYSAIYIVATEDNTQVTVTPSQKVFPYNNSQPFTVTLNTGQSIAVAPWDYEGSGRQAENHLGGTIIESDKPIAVVTSDDSVAANPHGGCRDLIGDQLIPVEIAGKQYIAMKGRLDIPEFFYVVGTEDNTDVIIDQVTIANIDKGEVFRYEMTKQNYHIETTEASYVYHVAGFGCEMGGAVLPPIDVCTGSFKVSFTRSKGESFFMNILVRAGAEDGFILNGDGPNTLISAADFVAVPGTNDWLSAEFEFDQNEIGVGDASFLENIKDVFHLGIINGGKSTGTMYGYFSNFNELEVGAGIGSATGPNTLFGCNGDEFQLVASDGVSYNWSPSDYLSDPLVQNPVASPDETIAYTVVVTGACNVTASSTITINLFPPVLSLFDVDQPIGCSPFDLHIDNQSVGVQHYSWRFGDGTYSTTNADHFTHSYQHDEDVPVVYDLELVGRSLVCFDTLQTQITVLPEVKTSIVMDDTQNDALVFEDTIITGCAPFSLEFDHLSERVDEFLWEFGDGTSSTAEKPVHTFENTTSEIKVLPVVLRGYSQFGTNTSCEAMDTIWVKVKPEAKAGFEINPPAHCNPYPLQITNTSSGASTYSWNFGDGNFSSDTVPQHTLENLSAVPRIYEVKLIVENDFGCSDTLIRPVTVYPFLNSEFNVSEQEMCNPGVISFENLSVGASSWQWNFDGAGTSSAENPADISFVNPGTTEEKVFNVQLTAMSEYGCEAIYSVPITVAPRLKAGFAFPAESVCSPYGVAKLQIENQSIGAQTTQWKMINTTNGTEEVFENADDTIHYEFENKTAQPIVFSIVQTVSNGYGCQDQITRQITVYPEVRSVIQPLSNGCHPMQANFVNQSINASSYRWEFSDGTNSFEENPSKLFLNTSNTISKVFTAKLYAESQYGCKHDTTFTFHVHPKPSAQFDIPDPQGCSPYAVQFGNQSISNNGSMFNWDFDDGHDISTTETEMEHVFHNSGDDVSHHMVQLIVTNTHGCSDTVSHQINIFPDVKADFDLNVAEGCHPLQVSITNTSEGATQLYPYQWNYGNGNSTNADTVHERVFKNFGHVNEKNFNIQLIATSQFGCKDTIIKPVTVFPIPEADFDIADSQGCSPHTTVFTDLSEGANLNYSWDFRDGNQINEAGSVQHTFTRAYDLDPGLFDVYLQVENQFGCADTLTKRVTVFPDIVADFSADVLSGCHPLQVDFTDESLGADDISWNFANGNHSSLLQTGNIFLNEFQDQQKTYDVELTVSSLYGCSDFASETITVYPKPSAEFSASVQQGCSPLEVDFTDHTLGTGNEQYNWQFGDFDNLSQSAGSVYYTFEHAADLADSAQVVLTAVNEFGCEDQAQQLIVVFPDIKADFSLNQTQGCHPLDVDITNTSTGATANYPYFWYYGDGTSSEVASEHEHRFNNFGHHDQLVFDLSLVALSRYGCRDSVSVPITVFPKPKANFEVENPTGCSPHLAVFNDLSDGSNLSYLWNFEQGETSQDTENIQYEYHQPHDGGVGNFVSSLTLTNNFGCSHTKEMTVTVYPDVLAEFDFEEQGCHPHTVIFENHSLGADNYTWSFGEGNTSNQEQPSNTFFNGSLTDPEKYPVHLKVSSVYGCSDEKSDSVKVLPKPHVTFSIDETQGCYPLSVRLLNESNGATEYFWDFGNGTSNTDELDFHHPFNNQIVSPDTFNISLTGFNDFGCQHVIEKEVVVFPEVKSSFHSESGEYEGCAPLELSFINNSELASRYVWYFGEDTTSNITDVDHTFFNDFNKSTDFEVGLKAISDYGCQDFSTKNVTVFQQPVADFDASPHYQVFPDRTVYIKNYSSSGPWQYVWDLGDGNRIETNSRNPMEHTYEWDYGNFATREFEITLDVLGGECADRITQKVVIQAPNPVVGFEPSAKGCPPFEVQFSNDSEYGTSFFWDFKDGNTSDEENPVHVFEEPGIYDVELTVYGEGGEDFATQRIEVFEKPIADFSLQDFTVEIPAEHARLINLSSLGDTYHWEFGDGNSSDEAQPTHYYEKPGVYDISLVVGSATDPQCFDQIIKKGVVTVSDQPCDLIFPNAFTPATNGSNGGSYEVNDPSNEVFHPVFTGVKEYNLRIFNRWGELLYTSDDIHVGWDGYVNGKLSPMGVYVYKAEAVCETGREVTKTGDVTLFR